MDDNKVNNSVIETVSTVVIDNNNNLNDVNDNKLVESVVCASVAVITRGITLRMLQQ